MTDSSSDLFELKNFFILGNYQAAINEGLSLRDLKESDAIERDVYLYRSYIAQGNPGIVLDEVKENAPLPLQAVRLLAQYVSSPSQYKDSVINTLREWMENGMGTNEPTVGVVAATLLLCAGEIEGALRWVHQVSWVEGMGVALHIFLLLHRLDLAAAELRRMQRAEDDATVTQLGGVWLGILEGGERAKEALGVVEELILKFGPSPSLLNAQALLLLQLQENSMADQKLLQALEKTPRDAATLANQLTTAIHLDKPPEVVARLIS